MKDAWTRLGRSIGAGVVIAQLCVGAAAIAAEEVAGGAVETKPVQLSLTEDIQLYGQETSVVGARFGVSSNNVDVTGYDVASLAARSTGRQIGLQSGVVGEVEGDLLGVQLLLISADVDGTATGVQWGILINRAGAVIGAQLGGLFNRAYRVTGVQLGLVNYAEDLEGAQLGLININRNGIVPVLPGLNFGF